MYQNIKNYISSLDFSLEGSRKHILNELASYILQNENPKLNFICTHNSRRSHLSQVWAQVFAHYFGIEAATYSGGTEATAFHPNAVAALRRAGLEITDGEGINPKYTVEFAEGVKPMICFSKTFDDAINPQKDFAAVMTCSEADSDCPFVHGASKRIKLFYEDPKVSDGTSDELKTYDKRCAQIASEMKYVFSLIK
ncbi:arsenate-mycothiol transferase ArsC [Ekhidna sp.]